jgi:phage tail-like protein
VRSYAVEVSWDGRAVAGVTAVSPLRTSTEVTTYRDLSGGVYKLPGRVDTAAVTLQRGVDADLAFDTWATGPALKKDLTLRLTDASDGLVVTYRLHGCWVCDYGVAPDPASGTVLESISLSVNRWERVTPPLDELARRWADERGAVVRRMGLAELLTGRPDETARRLDRLLSDAEAAGWILVFDEAEALFTRRTEVQDAHDRYQETELDAVVDRLARYEGSVLVEPPPDPPTA